MPEEKIDEFERICKFCRKPIILRNSAFGWLPFELNGKKHNCSQKPSGNKNDKKLSIEDETQEPEPQENTLSDDEKYELEDEIEQYCLNNKEKPKWDCLKRIITKKNKKLLKLFAQYRDKTDFHEFVIEKINAFVPKKED